MSEETPETDALCEAHYNAGCAGEAGIGPEISPKFAYGEVVNLARSLERRLQEAQRANLLLTASTTGLIQCVEKLERELAAERENSRQWKLLAEMNAAIIAMDKEDDEIVRAITK